MEKDMYKIIDKFFSSVSDYIVGISDSYVHPKRLREINDAKLRVRKLHMLFIDAFRSNDTAQVYKLVNMRHHPDFRVRETTAFYQPYANPHDYGVWFAFSDAIEAIFKYVEYNSKENESAAENAIKKWDFRKAKALQTKAKEYDFIPVVNKFFDDVFVFANNNKAKYTMPKSIAECEAGMAKLQSVREKIVSITKMENPDWKQVGFIGDAAMTACFNTSHKLFTDPKHENDNSKFFAFEAVLKGIIKYYEDDMKQPSLIYDPMKQWYKMTASNIKEKVGYFLTPAAKFAVIGRGER